MPIRIALGLLSAAWLSQAPMALEQWLTQNPGLSSSEIEMLDVDPVVKLLDVSESSRELAVFAAVRVAVPRAYVVEQLRGIEGYMRGEMLRGVGVFSAPPGPADIAGLMLPESDFEALEECTEDGCKVKLPQSAITEVLPAIDVASRQGQEQLTQAFRERVVDYVRRYQQNGNAELVVYADKGHEMSLAAGFDRLMSESKYLRAGNAELIAYLKSYPNGKGSLNAEDVFYWIVEDYGFRPVTAVVHGTLLEGDAGPETPVLFTQKQLYASHYFHARFETTALVDAGDAASPAVYILYLDRALFDDKLNWANRKLLASGVRKAVRSRLDSLRERLEREYAG